MAKRTAAWVTLLGLGATVLASDKGPWKPVVTEADLPRLVANESAAIDKALAGGLGEKKNVRKAQVSAIMVAAYAQSAMLGDKGKAIQLAGLRDQAVAVAEAAKGGKEADAKSLAGQLKAPYAGKPGSASELVELHKLIDFDDLMSQFEPERKGGKELEKKLKTYSGKRAALTAEEFKEVVLLGQQCAVIAQFTEALAPAADAGKKKKADWLKWSQEMGDAAGSAAKAAAAAKPDDKVVKAALRKLDDSCASCHGTFRDK